MKKILALSFLAMALNAQAQDACKFTINSNDAMQFDATEIKINKASCPEFTVDLNHTGSLPAAAMGHNVVITKADDVDGVAGDGAASPNTDYVKADDARVIAHTKIIGGGESASVTFKTDALEAAGKYSFFCSYPGHYAIMRGTVVVE